MRVAGVLDRLQGALPPVDAPWPERTPPGVDLFRLAAVLIPLYDDERGGRFLLTRRHEDLVAHPGQIALPGGRVEPSDYSPWHAALREAWEEVGIEPDTVAPIGRLSPVQVAASNNLIVPFLGALPCAPRTRLQREEVQEVFDVPISALLDAANVRVETWSLRGGRPYAVTYYRLAGRVVWGVTARILGDLARHLGVVWTGHAPGSVVPLHVD